MAADSARRWARALWGACPDQKSTREAEAGLYKMVDLIAHHDGLRKALAHPVVEFSAKTKVLRKVGKAAGIKENVQKFVILALKHGALDELSDVAKAFSVVADEAEGRVRATLEVAGAIRQADQDLCREALEKATGRSVQLKVEENPDLIGGARLNLGSTVVDGSVAGMLKRLQQSCVAFTRD